MTTNQLLKDFDALLQADLAKAEQDLAEFKLQTEELAKFNELQNSEKDIIFEDNILSDEHLNLQHYESD